MNKLVIILLAILPIITFSQGLEKKEIAWISLEKAKLLAKKHNQNILIYFYKKNCPYCDKMKKETFSKPNVISTINRYFLPVKINSRSKDTIYYNNVAYSNQQPIDHGYTFRHDFYAEVASFNRDGTTQSTTPTIALFNSNFKKTALFPGNKPAELLLRLLKKHIK